MNRTIQPEDRISHYRVMGPLGSGGMGEVYLAHDLHLERSVALKVLPFDLVRDEERVRRFVREAKSASSLNHPSIVAIYEIGHERVHAAGDGEPVSDPIHFISMELVTGETLGEKIRSHHTDLRTLLGYLTQAAEGIAKAHSAGIVHRDLKPSNIMISQDGYAKVLDFGLAKLLEREAVSGDLSATATVPLQTTKSGTLLGTVGYMSPEQIRGNKVDHRSDIFSFGCVLYECVTGQRAFRANTDVETLHQILHQAPTPAEELEPDVPHALQRLIRRCLARNPDRRLQSMKDLAIELQEIVDEYETLPPSSGSSAGVGSGGQPTVGGRRIPPAVLGVAVVVGLVGLVLGMNALLRGSGSKPAGVSSPAHSRVTGILGDVSTCALSPDGKYLAYAAGLQGSEGLWIRQQVTGSNIELSAAINGAIADISFSPDGSYVYFRAPLPDSRVMEVYRIPSLGGSPQRLLFDVDSRLSFSPDGRRACFRRGGIQRGESTDTDLVIVDLDTGEERILSTAPTFTFGSPAWSPSGERIVTIQAGRPDSLVVIDTATGNYEPLGQGWGSASSCAWLPEDRGVIVTASQTLDEAPQVWHVTYPEGVIRRITGDEEWYSDVTVTADGSTLAARRLVFPANLWSAPLAGGPAPRRLTKSSSGAGGMWPVFDVVDDGSIAVVWEGQLRLLDEEGTQIRSLTSTPDMRSRDPRGLLGGVLFLRSAPGEEHHIWHVELTGGAPTQLTSGPGEHIISDPVQDVFLHNVQGKQKEVFIGSVGRREPRKIPGGAPCAISPDGKWVFTTEIGDQHRRRIVVRSMETLELQLEFDLASSHVGWTPGSDAIAFVISAEESQQILLQPMDGSEPTLLLEITPARLDTRPWGQNPFRWSPDGETLCLKFLEDGVFNLWVVPSAGGEIRPITDFRTGMIYWYNWALDGQSVYFTRGNLEQDAVVIRDFE